MSDIGPIIDEIIRRRRPEPAPSRSRRGSSRGNRGSSRYGDSPPAMLNRPQDTVNVGDMASVEQYRYRLAQTAAQRGLGDEVVQMITEADPTDLPRYQQVVESDNPSESMRSMVFGDKNWVSNTIGDPGATALNRIFHELNRPLNAATGALTEILRDDPGANPLGLLESAGRGAWRGFDYDEHYGTNAILNEVEQYEIGGRNIPVPESGVPRAVANFAGDVVLDPLNFTRFGAAVKNPLDELVENRRAFVAAREADSEVTALRAMPKNQRGPVVERIIRDTFERPRTPTGTYRSRTVGERVRRRPLEAYDPALNRGVPRPPDMPKSPPKTYRARENLVYRILEEDDLQRLRTGNSEIRLEDYVNQVSEMGRRGHFTMHLAGRQVLGESTEGIYRNTVGRARRLGYTKAGDARALTRAFVYNRKDFGELPIHERRAMGNYASEGESMLHDVSNLRKIVDDEELDEIIEVLDAAKFEHVDPEDIFNSVDQVPLKNPTDTLKTRGDVARAFELQLQHLRNLEELHFIDPPREVFPLRPKGKRKLTRHERTLPIAELRRRGIQFEDPIKTLADDMSFRLQMVAQAEAVIKTLDQYGIKIADPRATSRLVTQTETGKTHKRTSVPGQELEKLALGDLNPTTQELLRPNTLDEADNVVNQITDPDSYLNTPEGKELLDEASKEAARRGITRVGNLELVPATRIQHPVVQRWLKANDIKAKDIIIPRSIADALEQMNKTFGKVDEATAFLRNYDKIMSMWKRGVTVWNPGYHIRNSFSDYFMNVAAGVANPLKYRQALRVILHRYDDAHIIKLAGQDLTLADAYKLYGRYSGSKTGQIRAEMASMIEKSKVARISEGREDWMRLAHFLDRFEKEALRRNLTIKVNGVVTGEARKLAQNVGDNVRYSNLDYGAKTPFERAVMARAIPFYTFLRRNLVLQAQLLLTQPGVIAAYPKYMELFQGLMGNPEEDDSTVLIPGWVRDAFPWLIETESRRQKGPINQLLNLFGIGDDGGAVVAPMENMLPIGTLNEVSGLTDPLSRGDNPGWFGLQEFIREQASSATPLAKVPFEIATDTSVFTGGEIDFDLDYLLSQLPVGRQASTLATEGPGGAQESITRWLTGAPIRQITPENEQSEFRRREDSLEIVRQQVLEDVNAELRALGMEEITSLPALDPDELINAILMSQGRRGRG